MRFVLVFALLVATSCREPRPEVELLAREMVVAAKSWDGVFIEFGSPRALPHLSEEGWSHGETAPDGSAFRWSVDREASFWFESEGGKQLAWLECEPYVYDGSGAQGIEILVNGAPVTELELRPVRESYPIELSLASGTNEVSMRFRYAGDPNRRGADRRRLAVKFFRFDVPPASEAPVAGRVGPFALVSDGIHLPAGGRVTFFASVDGKARLEVTSNGPGLTIAAHSEGGQLVAGDVVGASTFELEADGPLQVELSASRPVDANAELFAAPSPRADREPTRSNGNIVVVFLDGANALRMSRETTPVLEALESESVVFETAVSQAVYTIASIGSVLTGQYPERHQSVSFADKLRDNVGTFPAILAANGYRTAGFSGNAVVSETFGLHQGYREFFQVWESESYTGHGDSVLRSFRDWIETVGDERFFAYVHFREPHFPYNPPPPYDHAFGESELFPDGMSDWPVVERINTDAASGTPPSREVLDRIRALYEGNFAFVDDLVGQLVRCLEDRGLDDNTTLIVTADHGEALFEHDYIGHNTQLYEESVRVPLMIRLAEESPRRVEDVVELLDLAPTILELAGVEVPTSMQGQSLFDATPDRIAFTRSVWKRARYSARTRRHKLIWDSRTGESELYDLGADPRETHDVYGEDDFTSRYLTHRLLSWLRAQELLRGQAPDDATISDQQRELLESLGYLSDSDEKR